MWRVEHLILSLTLLWLGCGVTSISSFTLPETSLDSPASLKSNTCCRTRQNYLPEDGVKRELRCCIHYMYDSTGQGNLSREKAVKFARDLINSCNEVLAEATPMQLGGDSIAAMSKHYRLKIMPTTDTEDDTGIYFHNDQDLYYFVAYGKNKNNYSNAVIRKYALKPDSFINIFMLPHHPDSVKSPTYEPRRNGIALGTSLKVAGYYSKNLNPWDMRGLTNHEIGHILGLSHTWAGNDGCDDTPENPNCWNIEETPPCDKPGSNNMMDYNVHQNALTPCQLSIIHSKLVQWSSRTRKLVIPTWCEKTDTLFVDKVLILDSERDLTSDIIIRKGGILHIKCRLSMPENGKIEVQPGGQLILDNCWLHNSCNRQWQGIYIEKRGKSKGEVTLKGKVKIDNTPTHTMESART